MMEFKSNQANFEQIKVHLLECEFNPGLDTYTEDLDGYIDKLIKLAERFEVWDRDYLVGFLACYANNRDTGEAFITMVSVLPEYGGRGIASKQLQRTILFCKGEGFKNIKLEVSGKNKAAIGLYEKYGFVKDGVNGDIVKMKLDIRKSQ